MKGHQIFCSKIHPVGAESSVQPGTGAGISAAFGKLGATIGSYAFSELKNLGVWANTIGPMVWKS
jgi:hypothetical protein